MLPESVWKPSKGLYRHPSFKAAQPLENNSSFEVFPPTKVREDQFYASFADWLKNEAEEATQAIPIGGNVFRDRWGTPDVIGKKESRKSDVIQAPTEIVAPKSKRILSR